MYVLRLSLGGIISFLSIMVWNKTRDTAWMLIAISSILQYTSTISQILSSLGIIFGKPKMIAGVPVFPLVLSFLPQALTATALIWFLVRSKKR